MAKRFESLSLSGIAPETLALSLAFGLLLGTFPVYGCATPLCVAAIVALRLNMPAVQLVNFLSSPLQLALMAPFSRLGARLLSERGAAHAPQLQGLLHGGLLQFLTALGAAAMHAIAGWCFVCLPFGILLYLALGLRSRCRPAARAASN